MKIPGINRSECNELDSVDCGNFETGVVTHGSVEVIVQRSKFWNKLCCKRCLVAFALCLSLGSNLMNLSP